MSRTFISKCEVEAIILEGNIDKDIILRVKNKNAPLLIDTFFESGDTPNKKAIIENNEINPLLKKECPIIVRTKGMT